MKITLHADMLIDGEHQPAGSTVEVSKALGEYLVGAKRATATAETAAPTGVADGEPGPETAALTGSETTALPKGSKKTL